jgi:hypothetical protein
VLDDSLNFDDLLNVDRNLLDDFTNDNVGLSNNLVDFLDDDFLLDDLDFNDLGNLDNLLNNFFDVDWNLNNLLNNCLDGYNLFDDLDYLLDFRNNMVNWDLDLDNFSVDNYSIDNLFNFDDSRNFNFVLNNFFFIGRYLNDFFSDGRNLDKFFDDVIDYLDDFDWNMNDSFNFDEFGYFDNLLDVSFDWDDLRNLNDPLNDSFDDLFNFDDLGDNSEDLEDVIN